MRSDARGRAGVGVAALAAALVGVAAYVDTLAYWFVSSDAVPLIETGRMTAPRDLADVLGEPMLSGTRFVEFALFYRPLSTLSYAVDYRLWGLDPTGYHLTNVLLHGAAAAAATVALAAATRRRAAGALGGLRFAAHPLAAEVVPAASRRHDVLMTVLLLGALTLFVGSRRRDGRRALAGSLALYGLALLAKEPALVFPWLVVAWVALGWERPWRWPALRAAARAALPFVAVTVAYLLLRIAVLGELGGYEARPPTTTHDLVMVVVEYPLSLGYTHGVVGFGTIPGAGVAWHLLVLAMGSLAVGVLVAAGYTLVERGAPLPSVAALGCAAALLAVPVAVVVEPAIRNGYLYDYGRPTVVWAYPRPSSPVVGLLLVGAVVAAAAWAATGRSSLAASDRRALLFFAAWLAGPLVLFLRTGNYTPRSGYGSLAPAAGALALLAVVGAGGLRTRWRRSSDALAPADAAVLGAALLLAVPLVATSPLVHDYDGWETAGRVNEATLVGVGEAVEGTPPGAPVHVEGMVRIVADRGCSFPQAKTVQFARPGTVESWLRLHGEERRVSSVDDRVLDGPPAGVSVDGRYRNGTLTATVSYAGVGAGQSCLLTPWERY